MRGAGRVLGGMSLERAEPFWTHMSTYKPPPPKKTLKWAILSLKAKGVHRECAGRGDRLGVREECWGAYLSSERTEQARFSRAVWGGRCGNRSWCPSTYMLIEPCRSYAIPHRLGLNIQF